MLCRIAAAVPSQSAGACGGVCGVSAGCLLRSVRLICPAAAAAAAVEVAAVVAPCPLFSSSCFKTSEKQTGSPPTPPPPPPLLLHSSLVWLSLSVEARGGDALSLSLSLHEEEEGGNVRTHVRGFRWRRRTGVLLLHRRLSPHCKKCQRGDTLLKSPQPHSCLF